MVRAKQIHSLGEGVSKLFDGLHSSAEQACIELHVGASSGEFGNHPPIKLNVVHVEEKSAPPGTKPIEWFLLTTLPTNSQKQTERVGQRYRLRWRIEAWHRIPKSSCKVELLAHRTGDRIERAVTIKAVIAKRLAAMTLLGRETPELPMEVMFSDAITRHITNCACRTIWAVRC